MRNSILRIFISAFLTAAIVFSCSIGCLAAVNQTKYISDLRVCAAKSPEEAERELSDLGYRLVSNKNLNASLEEGMYLGYKTTLNPSEAITDVGVMNMLGNYSYSDYRTLIKEQEERVRATIDSLVPMIVAYRANYNEGRTMALEAYNILNKIYEDDSLKAMGDYLLSCDLENTDDLTKVFMQGYAPLIIDIKQVLFLAGMNNQDWLTRMAEGYSDDVLELYLDTYPTPNKAYKAMASDYGAAASDIRLSWDEFYALLSDTVEKYYIEDDGVYTLNEELLNEKLNSSDTDAADSASEMMTEEEKEKFEEAIDSLFTDTTDAVNINLTEYLNSFEYDYGTLLAFFMRPSDEVLDTELYNLAYYMGKNLVSQLRSINLSGVMQRVLMNDENTTMDAFRDINALISDEDQISVYAGVDRTLFTDGVALTGSAVQKNMSSQKSWSDNLFSRVFRTTDEYAGRDRMALFTIPFCATTGAWAVMVLCDATFVRNMVKESLRLSGKPYVFKGITTIAQDRYDLVANDSNWFLRYFFGRNEPLLMSTVYRVFFFIRTAFLFASIIIGIIGIIRLATEHGENEPEPYLSVPSRLVDAVNTEYGDDYVAYSPVLNTLDSAGDLNDYHGRNGWLMLYYTKDTQAGRPLTTDMKIIIGSDEAPQGFNPVRKFGTTDAADLTGKDFTGVEDKTGGTYLYFARERNLFAGSVFSGGYAAIAVAVGVVAGIIAGTLTAKAANRTRRKEQPASI